MARLYINGGINASLGAGGSVNNSVGNMYFGDNPPRQPDSDFNGKIDDIRIYDRALDEDAIDAQRRPKSALNWLAVPIENLCAYTSHSTADQGRKRRAVDCL